jgi:hypothetical protein
MTARRLILAALGAVALMATTAPAFADWDRGYGRGPVYRREAWREHEMRERAWREREWRERHRPYYTRPYVYAPPPVYYAPAW